jgi:hypothetical protein
VRLHVFVLRWEWGETVVLRELESEEARESELASARHPSFRRLDEGGGVPDLAWFASQRSSE